MASLNKVMLIGNLTHDPDVRYTPKGTAITEIRLAINRNYTTEAGEKREEVTYVDVSLFGRQGEIAAEYLKRGRPVFIEGRLRLETWDDKTTGQKRSKLSVVADGLQLLGGREGGGSGSGNSGGGEFEDAPRQSSRPPQQRPPSQRPSAPPRPPADPDLDVEGDDIPF